MFALVFSTEAAAEAASDLRGRPRLRGVPFAVALVAFDGVVVFFVTPPSDLRGRPRPLGVPSGFKLTGFGGLRSLSGLRGRPRPRPGVEVGFLADADPDVVPAGRPRPRGVSVSETFVRLVSCALSASSGAFDGRPRFLFSPVLVSSFALSVEDDLVCFFAELGATGVARCDRLLGVAVASIADFSVVGGGVVGGVFSRVDSACELSSTFSLPFSS